MSGHKTTGMIRDRDRQLFQALLTPSHQQQSITTTGELALFIQGRDDRKTSPDALKVKPTSNQALTQQRRIK